MAIQDQINRITNEVGTQSYLIEQVKGALSGKAVVEKPEDIGKPYIDTSKITDFDSFAMYDRLSGQENLLDTSNGTLFGWMFIGCSFITAPTIITKKGEDFECMFKDCENLTSVLQYDTGKGIYFTSMFDSCTNLTTIHPLDVSNGKIFSYMFENCSSLTTVPLLDITNGTSFLNMFYGCEALKTVSLTTAKSDLATNTFQGCSALENLTIGEGWAVSIYLNYSNNLTVESLHGMIENLADLTGKTAKTFHVGEINLAKIDEEHITMLQKKNWNCA